jgi:DNA-directed RNA polymerase specialized sigma24 family protein
MTGSELIAAYSEYQTQSDNALDTLLYKVRAYAMSITGDDDTSQEVVTRVWRSLPRYSPEKGNFAGWVRTISQNCARRYRAVTHQRTTAVSDEFLADLLHEQSKENGAAIRSTRLRDLLLDPDLDDDLVQLLSTAMSASTDLYAAGAILQLSQNQVTHKIRRLRKFVAEKSQTS